jgi:hypothetical protein
MYNTAVLWLNVTLYTLTNKPVTCTTIFTRQWGYNRLSGGHKVLTSSFDSCRAAPGFLEIGGGGALRLGPFVGLFSPLLPETLGETPPTLGDSQGSGFFFRGVTWGGALYPEEVVREGRQSRGFP